MFITCTKWQ